MSNPGRSATTQDARTQDERSPGAPAPDAPGQDDAAPDEQNPRRWQALAVALIGGAMVLLDVSIVNVALPSIRNGLQASTDQLQWVLSGYALAFGLFLVPAGRLGDMRGRRKVFIIALAVFTLASAGCGAAPTSTLLVVSRLVQGLAGGTLTPQISALIQQLFKGKERAKAFGWFGTVVGISTAIGPLLGGVLIQAFGENFGWRTVFLVNVPIGVVAMVLAARLIPNSPGGGGPSRRHDFDPVGIVLLGAGVVALLLPLVQEQQWPGATKWLLVPVAVVLLGGFLLWERHYGRRGHEPMVELHLFALRSYSFGTGMITLYFAGFTPLFFIYSLFLQNGQNYSALETGLASLPFAVGSGVAAIAGGRLVGRFGRTLIGVGVAMVAVGDAGTWLAVHLFPDRHTGWATVIPLLIAGLGSGLVISPNQTVTLSQVPVRNAGTAGGLLQTGQRIGAAIGIAAVGSVFFSALGGAEQGSSGSGGSGQAGAGQGARPDFPAAFGHGLLVAIGFLVVALVVAVVDVLVDRARSSSGPADGASGDTDSESGAADGASGDSDSGSEVGAPNERGAPGVGRHGGRGTDVADLQQEVAGTAIAAVVGPAHHAAPDAADRPGPR